FFPVPGPYYASGRGGARGDAHWSVGGNSSFSVSGQSFISHVPGGGAPVELINADADQAGILARRDFSDSAYWDPAVRNAAHGKATVTFKLPDSLTNWQVVVTAIAKDMHVGQHRARFQSYKPIMIWPMLPRVFTEGDRVAVYGTVHNLTDAPQAVRV